jgi:hypothetical protein
MQGLKPQVRWAVIIIGYLMIQFLNRSSSNLGVLAPVAEGVVVLYMIFAISTWIIGPVSDIFLRFHPFGKYVLTDEEKDVANVCAGLLTIAVVGAGMLLLYDDVDVVWRNLGLYLLCCGIALTVIVSSIASRTLERSKRRLRTAGIVFAVGCGVLIISALLLPAFALRLFDWLIWGFVGYQFYANSQE